MSEQTLHATTIAIDGRALLLMGPSGSGKSDLALRLIDRGAVLVSDDRTVLTVSNGAVLASSPATITGKIEVRGMGILDMPNAHHVPVAMIVRLGGPVERLPLQETTTTIADVAIPEIALDAFEGSAPIKVEMALRRVRETE